MKVLHKYLLIAFALSFLFFMPSCDRYESDGFRENLEEVTLQIEFDGLFARPSTRAQGSDPSVNLDEVDREDYVGKIAMLAFNSGTGKKAAEVYLVGNPIDSGEKITATMKEGTYDFFFIANYPNTDDASIKGLTDKAGADAYLQKLQSFNDYQGVVSNENVLFPMARVYEGQEITIPAGADAANIPFTPNVGTTNQLAPVSLFGKDWGTGAIQTKVRFVRSCAKIELDVTGNGRNDIQDVKYFNAAANYTFAELVSLPESQISATEKSLTLVANDVTEVNSGKLYVPERLFGAAEVKGWDNTTDAAKGGVNYIQITMNSGKVYKIPIISNQLLASTESYLDVARGNSTTVLITT